jgi:MYXO-CTERM domain-containing protein
MVEGTVAMKKPLILALLIAGAAAVARRRNSNSKADAALWAEATAPRTTER